MHDLRNPIQPLITVGQRKTDYSLTDKLVTLEDRSHVPLGKKLVQKVAFNTTLRHKHETPLLNPENPLLNLNPKHESLF